MVCSQSPCSELVDNADKTKGAIFFVIDKELIQVAYKLVETIGELYMYF